MSALRRSSTYHGVLMGSLMLTSVVLSFFRIRSTDIFWHLAAGRWMFENRELPRFDAFRFTSGEAPWIDHEWLFQVLVHSLERIGGLNALIALRVGLVCLLAAILYRSSRRIGMTTQAATGLAAISLFGIRSRMLLRPELFSFIAILFLLDLLEDLDTSNRRRVWKPISLMIVLTAVWGNLHGLAILSPIVAGLYLLGCRLSRRKDGSSIGRLLGVPALLLAAILVNPYGYKVLLVSRGITSAMRGLPGMNAEWMPQWLAPQPYFFFGVVALLLLTFLAYRRGLRPDPATGLVAFLFLLLAMTAVRHQALFFIGALPFASRTLAGLLAGTERKSRHSSLAALPALVACCLIVVWTLFPPPEGVLRLRQSVFTPGFGIEPGRFPEDAAVFLEKHPEIGPLFNTFAYGGYLLWRLYPERQVFHDGRMELVPELLGEIGAARANARQWEELMARYGVDGAIVRYETRRIPVLEMGQTGELKLSEYRTANALLFPRSLYALVYWDDVAMVLLRRTSQRSASLAESEYRHIDPEDPAWTLDRAARDPQFAAAALREARRRVLADPASSLARRLQDELARVYTSP